MANRSDARSVLPRRLKRMLSLSSIGDAHRDGEVRRLFISAHKTAMEVRDRRSRASFEGGENVDSSTQAALVQANSK